MQPPRLPGLAGLSHRSRRAWLRRAIAGLCSWSCAAIREGSCRSAQAAHSHARGRALHAHAHTHTHTRTHTYTHTHTSTRTHAHAHAHTHTHSHAHTHARTKTHAQTDTKALARTYARKRSTLQHSTPHCNTVHHTATQCDASQSRVPNVPSSVSVLSGWTSSTEPRRKPAKYNASPTAERRARCNRHRALTVRGTPASTTSERRIVFVYTRSQPWTTRKSSPVATAHERPTLICFPPAASCTSTRRPRSRITRASLPLYCVADCSPAETESTTSVPRCHRTPPSLRARSEC